MLKLSFALLALAFSAGSIAAPVISSSAIDIVTDFWQEPNPEYTGGFFDPEPEYITHTYIGELTNPWDTTAIVQVYTFSPELNNLHTVEIDYTFSIAPADVVTLLWGWDDTQAGVRVTNCVGSGFLCDVSNVGSFHTSEIIYSDSNTQYFNSSPLSEMDLMVGTQIDRVPLWNDYYGYVTPSSVPVPAAAWLFGSAILGLVGIKRKKA